MKKNLAILLVAIAVVALPFIFRQPRQTGSWKEGDPVLVVISPHIASIRDEFEHGFSEWHLARYGKPVRIDWRNIGGTTEIMRYLQAEQASSFKAWWAQTGHIAPTDSEEAQAALRATDDPAAFTTKIDVFFGGGTYDHGSADRKGLTVRIWPEGKEPVGIIRDAQGRETFPEARGGEQWRNGVYYSAVLSAFGICYNYDRLRDLGIETPPTRWRDLADPRFYGQVGVTDPTKSGSIAKAFEMIVHSECQRAVREAGFDRAAILAMEKAVSEGGSGEPSPVLSRYQAAVERGWANGIALLQIIGANARYFTDGASKVAIDVSTGDAAAGISIDFYARVQADVTRAPDGTERMGYTTPVGGSSVSGDPISILRGAPQRELAERFVQFVLSPDGQKLWNYRVGEPGGPVKYALRRLPVLREFYPAGTADWPSPQGVQSPKSEVQSPATPDSELQSSDSPPPTSDSELRTSDSELRTSDSELRTSDSAAWSAHAPHTSDPLTDPAVDAYALSGTFDYIPRWTGPHFAFFRLLVRSMCMDAGPELKAAWRAIMAAGGPDACPEAMAVLRRLPPGVTWETAPAVARGNAMDLSREWTLFFRDSYRQAEALASRSASTP